MALTTEQTCSVFLIVVSFLSGFFLSDVDCRDASNLRISDPWPKLVSSDQKTTPWPALGNSKTSYVSNQIWFKPNSTFHSRLAHNLHTGSSILPSSSTQRLHNGPPISVSEVPDDELREFSENLLKKDVNNAAQYVTINLQGKTTSRSEKDEAPSPLLQIKNEAFTLGSIPKLLLLHDNYILETTANEIYTPAEEKEEDNFLKAVINTPVMQATRNFLIKKGKIGSDANEFEDVLREIWFNMYTRGSRKVSSSGFEHVFVTEIKNNQISGLHNWLYFNSQELTNRANYLGYMKKIDLGDKGAILKFHFTFKGIDKPVASMFVGTSPEFEMALYTSCFLLRADKVCPLKLNGNRFIIRTFTYRYKGKQLIGSAFPEI